jgi:hypothetical protein
MKNIYFNRFAKYILDLSPKAFNAALTVKGWRPLYNHIFNMILVVVGKKTPYWVKITIITLKNASKIHSKQGLPGLVKYLKVSSVVIQQIIGGHKEKDLTSLGPRISRTKSGIPRILAPQLRRGIALKDPTHIKWALTLMNIYRVILYIPKKAKLSTIIDPRTSSLQMERSLYKDITIFLQLFCKNKYGISYLKSIDPFPIYTSSPNSQTITLKKRGVVSVELSTDPSSIIRSREAWWYNSSLNPGLGIAFEKFVNLHKVSYNYSAIWSKLNDLIGNQIGGVILDIAKGKGISDKKLTDKTKFLGKLGFKVEPAGKIRVFAMVDPFTQWALKPLHLWLFSILKKNHTIDATFNHTGPLSRVPVGKSSVYSYDLSAATDRLPVSLQEAILRFGFGSEFASCWRKLLVDRSFLASNKELNIPYSEIKYKVGQPMGALSSWAMLALTHHFIVQCAAWRSGYSRNTLFKDYVLLGDDIIIWHTKVAETYYQIMTNLGVSIGLAKSVISIKGESFEFAKRTVCMGHDVSPVPFKEYAAATKAGGSFIEFVNRYSLSDVVIKRLLGLGYRSTNRNIRWRVYSLLKEFPHSMETISAFFLLCSKRLSASSFNDAINVYKTSIVKLIKVLSDNLSHLGALKTQGALSDHINMVIWYHIHLTKTNKSLAIMESVLMRLVSLWRNMMVGSFDLSGNMISIRERLSRMYLQSEDIERKVNKYMASHQKMEGSYIYKPHLYFSLLSFEKLKEITDNLSVNQILQASQRKDARANSVNQHIVSHWASWSRVIFNDYRSSSVLPIRSFSIKKLFVTALTVSDNLGARRNFMKRISTPIKFASRLSTRGLITLWVFEGIYSVIFSSLFVYISLLMYLLIFK